MTHKQANYVTAANEFNAWRQEVRKGTPPTLYPVGCGEMARLEVGPGLVTLVGGAPNAGKTALTQQWVFDALRLNLSLRVCVCAVEMSPRALLDRQLARLSGVDASQIRSRKLTATSDVRVDSALATLGVVMDRLCFVRPPFDLDNVAASAKAFGADLLVVDYVQRVRPAGQQGDSRGAMNATMASLRQLADAGMAVIVVSAVGRTKDSKGRPSYDGGGLNLASFRESSELEFGADDAFILMPGPKSASRVCLRHLKSRYGQPRDLTLVFDRRHQRFAAPPGTTADETRGKGPEADEVVIREAPLPTETNDAEKEGE